MKPVLVVLAAGGGSRYGGLKQLAPIGPGGATLLEYSVHDALRAGFSGAVLVIRPEHEPAFRDRFDAAMARRVPVTYVHQRLDDLPAGLGPPARRSKPWGTGHAVLAAAAAVAGPFAVANADDFYGAGSFAALAEAVGGSRSEAPLRLVMVGFDLAETLSESGPVSRALCRLDDRGFLQEIVEIGGVRRSGDGIVCEDCEGVERPLTGDEPVSMNLWGFTPEIFPELRRRFGAFLAGPDAKSDGEFFLPEAVDSLVREGLARVRVLRGTGRWCGLTYRADEQRVAAMLEDLVARGQYPERLWG